MGGMTAALLAEAPVEVTQPGIYDIAEDIYHADPVPGGSLSFSGAKRLLPPSCPAKFKWEREHPRQSSQAMELGTAAHKLALGAGADIVVLDYENWRKKEAQDAGKTARLLGKVPMLAAEYAEAEAIAKAVRAHPLAGALLDPACGAPERSLFWQDPATGVWLRSRLDWLQYPGRRNKSGKPLPTCIVDLKTTNSADPDSIAGSVWKYRYFMQAPFYVDGVCALGYDTAPAFVFVFVETEAPYLVTIAQLDDDALEAGRTMNRLAIERYRDCMSAGLWPGYSPDPENAIERISLSPWSLRLVENMS
jgi:PDDEXK-like domain of unknown function (DUF3799)